MLESFTTNGGVFMVKYIEAEQQTKPFLLVYVYI